MHKLVLITYAKPHWLNAHLPARLTSQIFAFVTFWPPKRSPFAGHPTIATVAALRHRGFIGDGPLTLETLAGCIEVNVSGADIKMTQIAPEFGPFVPAELVAPVGGLSATDIAHPPQVVSTGLPFCITVLKTKDALERVKFNTKAFDKLHPFSRWKNIKYHGAILGGPRGC